MSSEWTIPPLRGPLGLRELLVLRPERDLFRTRHPLAIPLAFFGVGFGLALAILWFIFRESQYVRSEPLWVAAIVMFIVSELVFGAFGARTGPAVLGACRRRLRLEEIRLTLLRPVTIGQIMLHPSPKLIRLLLAGLWLGYACALLSWRPDLALHLIPPALLAINAAITWVTSAWIHLTFAFGLATPLKRLSAAATLTAVYILASALASAVFAFVLFTGLFFNVYSQELFDFTCCVAMALALMFMWVFKVVIARAHVARLEQIVFPRLSD